jgi:hypothetical protein
VVENEGEGTAYITDVEVEVWNSTSLMLMSYSTLGKGFWDGLIKAKSVDSVGAYPTHTWIMENGRPATLQLSPMRGKAYRITIALKDGEETILASETFTDVFSAAVNREP